MKRFVAFGLIAALLLAGMNAWADSKRERVACVFDPVGADGFVYELFSDYALQARDWGYALKPRAYTDEAVAANDFKAGECDMVVLSGVRTRALVPFAGSLDMAGGLQTYDGLRRAIKAMAAPKAAPLMQANGNEVVGVVPMGRVFLFARDRDDLQSLDRLAGKRIAILSYDRASRRVVEAVGASPVPADIASLGPLFNNGSADLTYAPAIAYQPLELEHGITPNGGFANFVLGTLSGQIVVHQDRFAPEFGARSRTWVADTLSLSMIERLEKAEARLPYTRWVVIDPQRIERYQRMFREVREQLWQEDWYSHRMQKLLKKLRCAETPALAECSLDSEGGPVY